MHQSTVLISHHCWIRARSCDSAPHKSQSRSTRALELRRPGASTPIWHRLTQRHQSPVFFHLKSHHQTSGFTRLVMPSSYIWDAPTNRFHRVQLLKQCAVTVLVHIDVWTQVLTELVMTALPIAKSTNPEAMCLSIATDRQIARGTSSASSRYSKHDCRCILRCHCNKSPRLRTRSTCLAAQRRDSSFRYTKRSIRRTYASSGMHASSHSSSRVGGLKGVDESISWAVS